MKEWGFIGQDTFVGIGSPSQFLNLNKGVAMCERRG